MIDRMYLQYGSVVHAIETAGFMGQLKLAVCGADPHGHSWKGSGSQAEYEMSELMPRCEKCSRKLGRWDW